MDRSQRTAILSGTTAAGKSALAMEAAELLHLEIINSDSLLFYRGADIGTAKPSREARQRIPHHLIDICDPDQIFTAGDFVKRAKATIQQIHERGKGALIVGGSGFYLKALSSGMWPALPASPKLREALEAQTTEALREKLRAKDPAWERKVGTHDRYRLIRALEIIELTGQAPSTLEAQAKEVKPAYPLVVVDRAPRELEARIEERTREMVARGLIEETQRLREAFPQARLLNAVGYRQACEWLEGKAPQGRSPMKSLNDLIAEITLATRQLAKSQRTWFKSRKEAETFLLDAERGRLMARLKEIYP